MPSVYADLYATGEFESMSSQTDEAEHSIEMQLPYIAKVMERCVYVHVCTSRRVHPSNLPTANWVLSHTALHLGKLTRSCPMYFFIILAEM